jgi:hypothetical protein
VNGLSETLAADGRCAAFDIGEQALLPAIAQACKLLRPHPLVRLSRLEIAIVVHLPNSA